jgi:hypothetical protein
MTRRNFLLTATAGLSQGAQPNLVLPIQQVIDSRANFGSAQLDRFSSIWAEATRDLRRCGIEVQVTRTTGEIRRSPSGMPIFKGLAPNVINLVITNRIPVQWDNGRGLSGVTTRWEGYHLCIVAMDYAHAHDVPFFSVNTCMHELLHAILQDIYESKPKGFSGETRELKVDVYATRVWLFHDGSAIRQAAQMYLQRLRAPR